MIGFWTVHIKIGYKLKCRKECLDCSRWNPEEKSAVSSQGNRKKKEDKEKYEANGVVTDDISSLKV